MILKRLKKICKSKKCSFRIKKSEKTRLIPLKFIVYTFGFTSDMKSKKQSDFIKDLNNWNFKTSELNKTIEGIDNLVKYHFAIEKKRFNLKYDRWHRI